MRTDWVAKRKHDKIRTQILERGGHHVVRFWNHDVLGNIDGVLEALVQELNISR